MARRSFRRNCSGQVIIVTALLVAMILLTTALYVIEVEKSVPTVDANSAGSFDAYLPALRSTLISALANASAGGNSDILKSDLAQLKTAILSHSYDALLTMDYSTKNSGGYTNGLNIAWGSSGSGVSEASASFTFSSSSTTGKSDAAYTVELSSRLQASGSYSEQNGTKQVNLTVNVLNDGSPALAESFGFSYQTSQGWVQVDSLAIVDHGNGSYSISFTAETGQTGEPLVVSAVIVDERGISVGANLTCNPI